MRGSGALHDLPELRGSSEVQIGVKGPGVGVLGEGMAVTVLGWDGDVWITQGWSWSYYGL